MNKTFPIAPRHGLMLLLQFSWLALYVATIYFGSVYFLEWSQKTFLGLIVISIVVYIVGIFFILIQSYKRLSQGAITLTDTGVHWIVKGTNGQLVWSQPMSVSKGVFYRQQGRYAISVPMLSCVITQAGTQVTFVREANVDEVMGLPQVSPGGIYLAVHGREVMNEILKHAV